MEEWGGAIREDGNCIEVSIRVTPRSSRRGCTGLLGERVRFNLHAAPVEDAANRELIEVLAGGMKVSRGSVRIVKGSRSRDKTVRIADVSIADFQAAFLNVQR